MGRAVASAVALFVARLLHLLHVSVYDIWADFNKPGLGSEIAISSTLASPLSSYDFCSTTFACFSFLTREETLVT